MTDNLATILDSEIDRVIGIGAFKGIAEIDAALRTTLALYLAGRR
jgi:hypothetical protein